MGLVGNFVGNLCLAPPAIRHALAGPVPPLADPTARAFVATLSPTLSVTLSIPPFPILPIPPNQPSAIPARCQTPHTLIGHLHTHLGHRLVRHSEAQETENY
jgi:hypothetical protein